VERRHVVAICSTTLLPFVGPYHATDTNNTRRYIVELM